MSFDVAYFSCYAITTGRNYKRMQLSNNIQNDLLLIFEKQYNNFISLNRIIYNVGYHLEKDQVFQAGMSNPVSSTDLV